MRDRLAEGAPHEGVPSDLFRFGKGSSLNPSLMQQPNLIVIGASAGGPTALATILSALPAGLPAAILIVQHVDLEFVPGIVSWLDERCAMPVRIAIDGERPPVGNVLIAGTGNDLVFTGPYALGYRMCETGSVYCPSADVLFASVAAHWKSGAVGILLTGMGRDGAIGLKAMRDAGALTIAQDQATSVVYGMPKAAAEIGAAVRILPLDGIAPLLVSLFKMRT